MGSMIERLDALIAWIDRGRADSDIQLALDNDWPLDAFREALWNTRECILEHPRDFESRLLAVIDFHLLANATLAEETAFGHTLQNITRDLHHMSYVLGALRKTEAITDPDNPSHLKRVIDYLERIRQLMGEQWSWDVEGMAELCDDFRRFVAQLSCELYKQLGHDFQALLELSPRLERCDIPRSFSG